MLNQRLQTFCRQLVFLATVFGVVGWFLTNSGTASAAGTWKQLTNPNPMLNGTMLLLTDGTVMVEGFDSQTWSKLTPDSKGSYAAGTWKKLAQMSIPRLYFASHVLPSGKVFVLGGEYSGANLNQNITNTGEIYDPVTNQWSPITPFPQPQFGDDPSILLPNGKIICGYIFGPQTYTYDPVNDLWSQSGTKLRQDRSDEETWVQIPGNQFVSYDVFASDTLKVGHAQRYDFKTDAWLDSGIVPVIMSSNTVGFELGPATMLPNGQVFQVGANELTALYTPAANGTGAGTWAAGPKLPNGMGADDAPGAMLPDGHFVFLADFYLFNTPTKMYDYNYLNNKLTDITNTLPAGLQNELNSIAAYEFRMLVLPNGNLLLGNDRTDTPWEYTPATPPQAAWKPSIASVSQIGTRSYLLSGSKLNGISQGASYGDDAEMSSNYPIVRVTQGTNVVYAKTTKWTPGLQAVSDTSLATVQFDLPATINSGTYLVSVISNGIPSSNTATITFAPHSISASFANGNLKITGSTQADNITVTYNQVKVSGVLKGANVTVAPGDPFTLINGKAAPVTFDVGLNRFTVDASMDAGDDTVTFTSLYCTNVALDLGAGSNDVATFQYCSILTTVPNATSLSVVGGTEKKVVHLSGNSITKKTSSTNITFVTP